VQYYSCYNEKRTVILVAHKISPYKLLTYFMQQVKAVRTLLRIRALHTVRLILPSGMFLMHIL